MIEANVIHQQKLPGLQGLKSEADIEKVAKDFTSVFFNECVNIMLEEARDPDEDFSGDTYRVLHAQILGEKLADGPAGQEITQMLATQIYKMQDKLQGGHNG